jgi:hypothetical protein
VAVGAMIPGVGPSDVAPLLNPNFDPSQSELTPEHYFVMTRVDGRTSLKQIVLISGFAEDKTVGILQKLRTEGAIYLPGEPLPPRRVAPQPKGTPQPQPPVKIITRPPERVRAEAKIDESLLAEEVDLSPEQKRAILVKQAAIKNANLFEILEVGAEVDKKTLKRAYFKISKEFHPDRFYGKHLGSFRDRLDQIFHVATKAFEHLDDDEKRAAYVESLKGQTTSGKPTTAPPGSQSPAARAQELFDLACQHQVTGEVKRALQEFAAAIRLDPQPRYLKRAAEAALRAQELRSAEEYATKAAELDSRDAGVHRMLAKVFRASGRDADAKRELETAIRLAPDDAFIAAELEELNRR